MSENEQPSLSRLQVTAHTRAVFAEEAKSPRATASKFVLGLGTTIAFAYTGRLALGGQSLFKAWLRIAQPVVDTVAVVVPSVSNLGTELIKRGVAPRAPFVAHAVAFQWLTMGVATVLAAALILREGPRLRRVFAKLRAEKKRLRPPNYVPWRMWIAVPVAAILAIWLPFAGRTAINGSVVSYDLATGDLGLFVMLLLIVAWWWGLYWAWRRLLAFTARSDAEAGVPSGPKN